jgi:hypothetical protein
MSNSVVKRNKLAKRFLKMNMLLIAFVIITMALTGSFSVYKNTGGVQFNFTTFRLLLIDTVLVFIIYTVVSWVLIQRLLFRPLGKLTRSIPNISCNINSIYGIVRDMASGTCAFLSDTEVLSVFIAPIFMEDNWWGFAGFNDCRRERNFSENEAAALRSCCLLIENAFLSWDQ